MKTAFETQLKALKKITGLYDDLSNKKKLDYLKVISKIKFSYTKSLTNYLEILLFNYAHPGNPSILLQVEKEIKRLSVFLKKQSKNKDVLFVNSGLPYTKTFSKYSHDCISQMLTMTNIQTSIATFENPSLQLNDVLKHTLPSLEISETTAGLNNSELFASLSVKKDRQLPFLINEVSKLDEIPFLKDQLFEGLDLYVNVYPKDETFSKSGNRLKKSKYYFHKEIIKYFSFETLLNTKLPSPNLLNKKEKLEAIATVKNSMILTARETDPTTYMDENSFKLYELERGITIAIYGMIPKRQLPLESYVGFTLFKNGFPAAYGGGWVFGERSHFGINIFESFRGGESGYMLCQLLRVYHNVFKINYFEVEPYQYGLDNPEGIQSGAFWFYYRFGFRPLDKKLLSIAKKESLKIKSKKGYRTNTKTLEQFTESNIALNLGKETPPTVNSITSAVTKMINQNFKSNRILAESVCVNNFIKKTGFKNKINIHEKQVLKEVALWAEAFQIIRKDKLSILKEMIKTKPINLYDYQQLLLNFFQHSKQLKKSK